MTTETALSFGFPSPLKQTGTQWENKDISQGEKRGHTWTKEREKMKEECRQRQLKEKEVGTQKLNKKEERKEENETQIKEKAKEKRMI
jgi:hypothetical protein